MGPKQEKPVRKSLEVIFFSGDAKEIGAAFKKDLKAANKTLKVPKRLGKSIKS
jgi:hypothetical protein